MNISIKFIPHDEQRYETVGDWWFDANGDLEIRVSQFEDPRLGQMVAVHELVEVLLCKDRDITQRQVDEFDEAFEANRQPGNLDEPGDDPEAPYHLEHGLATSAERMLASSLGINWKRYEEACDAMKQTPKA